MYSVVILMLPSGKTFALNCPQAETAKLLQALDVSDGSHVVLIKVAVSDSSTELLFSSHTVLQN